MAGGSGLTRGAVSLTHRAIEALRPAEVPYRISDQRCVGLAVRVPPSGIKTWDLSRLHRARQQMLAVIRCIAKSDDSRGAGDGGQVFVGGERGAKSAVAEPRGIA